MDIPAEYHVAYHVSPSHSTIDNLIEWANTNCNGLWLNLYGSVYLFSEADVVFAKLQFNNLKVEQVRIRVSTVSS
jgi:hypothetical protein